MQILSPSFISNLELMAYSKSLFFEANTLNANLHHINEAQMAKVTEQDAIHFLREKVLRIAKELETAQGALDALQEATGPEAPSERVRKSATAAGVSSIAKGKAKSAGAKRGQKSGAKQILSETQMAADQLG